MSLLTLELSHVMITLTIVLLNRHYNDWRLINLTSSAHWSKHLMEKAKAGL